MGADDKPKTTVQPTPAQPTICSNDIAAGQSMALLFMSSKEGAPLPVTEAIREKRDEGGERTQDDYKAVWAWTPKPPDPSLLLFFHGNHHYVTVDSSGASRVPDWAEKDKRAVKGVRGSAHLYYKLNELDASQTGLPADLGTMKQPVVLVPEDVELLDPEAKDWAAPPTKQYTDTDRLGKLVYNCYKHLLCLPIDKKIPSVTYLVPNKDKMGPSYPANLKRLYLCGHSGGGKPLLECAASDWVVSGKHSADIELNMVPVDLWLFDATYKWTTSDADLTNYDDLCKKWSNSNTLGNRALQNRFVCVFREGTSTEDKANTLLGMLAKTLKKDKKDLLFELKIRTNIEKELIPLLSTKAVLFVKIKADRKVPKKPKKPGEPEKPDVPEKPEFEPNIDHEELPKRFIPWLLWTSAS